MLQLGLAGRLAGALEGLACPLLFGPIFTCEESKAQLVALNAVPPSYLTKLELFTILET